MQWGQLEELKARLKTLGLNGKINTASIECLNLTIHQTIAPSIRRTWCTAQTLLGCESHAEW
jgi:hypothetical protein